MGRDSCRHLCRKSLHSQCRYSRQCSNWCWDRQMPEIQWPSWHLVLSTSCKWNHWCVRQVHCPLLELSRKETRWHFRQPQGATVAPPAPVSGRGQREHRQHIGLCARDLTLATLSALTVFLPITCLSSMYSHRLLNVCIFCKLHCLQYAFYAFCKASVQYCFAPLFSHPD